MLFIIYPLFYKLYSLPSDILHACVTYHSDTIQHDHGNVGQIRRSHLLVHENSQLYYNY